MKRQRFTSANSAMAALVLSLFFTPGLPGQGEQLTTEERIVSGGIITAEKTELRSGPSDSASVVKELHFGDPFFIVGRDGASTWSEVLLADNRTRGWIMTSAAEESNIWKDDFQKDGLASLYYNVGVQLFRGWRKYDAAESLFVRVLKQPEGTRVTVDDTWGIHEVDGKDAALECLAEMSWEKHDYDRAIMFFENLAVSQDTTAAAMACLRVAEICLESKKDNGRAIQESYETMKRFQNVRVMPDDETVVDVDVEAVETVRASLRAESAGAEEYLRHGKKMIGLSRNPTTGIIGYLTLCEGYRKLGQYVNMMQAMSEGLRRWPVGLSRGFKGYSRDYSGDGVAFVVNALLEDAKDQGQALQFCDKLISETKNDTLLHNLFLARGFILDLGQGPLGPVIEAYRQAQLRPPPDIGDYPFSELYGRMEHLLTFGEYGTRVIPAELGVKAVPDNTAMELFTLKEGDAVVVLCDAPPPYDGTWLKVMAGGDRCGWVRRSSLEPEYIPALSPFDSAGNWWCPGANSAHTSSVGGSAITHPALLWRLAGVAASEVIYSDADGDGICDLILGGWEGNLMAVISGRDRRVIWSTGEGTAGKTYRAPSVNEDLLAFTDGGSVGVRTIHTGELVWARWVFRDIPTPVLAGDTAFFHVEHPLGMHVMGIGFRDGKTVLEYSNEGSYERFPLTLVREPRLVIVAGDRRFQNRVSLCALSTDGGREIWSYDALGQTVTPVVVQDSLALFVSQDKKSSPATTSLIALDNADGRELFTVGLGECAALGLAALRGLSVVACAKSLRAFSLRDGASLWDFQAREEFCTQPCIVDTVVYVGESSGRICALNLHSGELLWEFDVQAERWGKPMSPISSSSGMLSFVTGKGYLFVLGNKR